MHTPGYGTTPNRFVRVAYLLPRQRGNVAVDNYMFVNALLQTCRTEAPWRDLLECYGKWVTVHQRLDRWSGNGATGCLSTALQEERVIGVETQVPAMDSTSEKAHQHVAGVPKKGAPGPSASPGEGGTSKSVWYPITKVRSSGSIRARTMSTTRPTSVAHGPRMRGGSDPAAGRVVRPDTDRAPQEEPYGPMGLQQGGV